MPTRRAVSKPRHLLTTSGKQKGKGWRWEWECDLYGVHYILILSPWDLYTKYAVDTLKIDPYPEDKQEPTAHTLLDFSTQMKVVYWFPPVAVKDLFLSAPVIAHEALHGVLAVMHNRGIDVTADAADEAAAYYLGWMVGEINRRLVSRAGK